MDRKIKEVLREKERRYEELTQLLVHPETLKDRERFSLYSQEHGKLEEIVTLWKNYQKKEEELKKIRLLLQEEDRELISLAKEEKEKLEKELLEMEKEINRLLGSRGEEKRKVIVEIRAGTGGEEAALFAADLYRMYLKFAEKKGWKVEPIHSHPTSMGGFKEVIFGIEGNGSYSILKQESGVHRVQRIPATESGGRIHTSTATVAVLPEPEEVEVQINPEDLKIETFRASGPGGQYVNVTDSAVRITHLPTQIVVQCQDERSQHQNKAKAMRVLRAELLRRQKREQEEKISRERKQQIGTGERSERIRTYNFPQNRVTDHRAKVTVYNLEEIMEGNLEEFLTQIREKLTKRQNPGI